MKEFVHRSVAFIWSNLGHCALCMRKAFIAGAVAWAATLLVAVTGKSSVLLTLTEIGAVGATLLWIAHMVAFAGKASNRRYKADPERSTRSLSRRALIPMFSNVLIFAAFLSVAPRGALAATIINCACTGGKTTSGCCPSDNSNVCNCKDPQNPVITCGDGPVTFGPCV